MTETSTTTDTTGRYDDRIREPYPRARRVTPEELRLIVPDSVDVELDHAAGLYVAVFGGKTYVAAFDLASEVA
jgi:hypothetical protein